MNVQILNECTNIECMNKFPANLIHAQSLFFLSVVNFCIYQIFSANFYFFLVFYGFFFSAFTSVNPFFFLFLKFPLQFTILFTACNNFHYNLRVNRRIETSVHIDFFHVIYH